MPTKRPSTEPPDSRAALLTRHSQRHGFWEGFWIYAFRGMAYGVLLAGVLLFGIVIVKGLGSLASDQFPYIRLDFFTEGPESLYVFDYDGQSLALPASQMAGFLEAEGIVLKDVEPEVLSYAAGGILPAIAGTFFLVIGAIVLALILGISAAIYLSEYSRDSRKLEAVRLAIVNLAGVPSIIYGLFGFGLFVLAFQWGQSLLAGWFTLGILALPLVIRASEEALQAVPMRIREASLALGATRWQTIYRNVLPQAFSGILTASILSIVRVAGETAPILFTAAFAFRDNLPWEVDGVQGFFSQGVMALPYHLYIVSTRLPATPETEAAQYGTAMAFVLLLVAMTGIALYLRQRVRREQTTFW